MKEEKNFQQDFTEEICKDNEKKDKEKNCKKNLDNNPKNNKKQRVTACIIAVVIALCSFLGGWLVCSFTWDEEMRSLKKLKKRIQQSYFEQVTDEQFYGVLFDAVNERILDDYSWYMTEEEYAQTRSQAKGNQSGLGLFFITGAEGIEEMRVTRVSGNSPAEEKGIVAGEYITGYGKTEQSVTPMQRLVQEGDGYFDTFAKIISQIPTGETFYLQVRGIDERERIVAIAKKAYVESYVFYRSNDVAYTFIGEKREATERGIPLASLPDDAAYIRLTQFNGEAAKEFASAMSVYKAQRKKTLVLDLRGNGGGYLDIMREIASYFCKNTREDKPIVAIADYGEYSESFCASGNYYQNYFTQDSRIYVLADDQTASASECLLGCMLDYGAITFQDICLTQRGNVAKTYGKGIMQTTYSLSGLYGDAVKLTTARIIWPVSKTCIHGRGIVLADGTKAVMENKNFDKETSDAIAVIFG